MHVLEAIEGGVARHMVNLVRHADAEHIVVVPPERVGGVTDLAAFEAMDRAGARVELLDMRRSPADRRTLAAVLRVHLLVRKYRPHIVHGHSAIGGAVARLASHGTRARRVYTPHGLYPTRGAYTVERALGRSTDCLVAMSASEAQLVAQQRLVPSERVVVIPNAVELAGPEPSRFDLRRQLGVDSRVPLVGTVARLAHQKAPEVFVRACARIAAEVPEACFVMVGDGALLRETQREVSVAQLTDRFLVVRDRNDGAALMTQFDVFVLASRYEAGAPYAVMEAMRAGTPVVVTDVVGNRDAIEHGSSGFMVGADDPAAVARAVVPLLRDPALHDRVAGAARDRLRAYFDVRDFGAAFTDLYRGLTGGRPTTVSMPRSRQIDRKGDYSAQLRA
jgi:glycosyltransferase involved in cell wall biosynthesis